MNKINKNIIVKEILVCPYCLNEVNYNMSGHCGESNSHFEKGYVLKNDEIVLDSEVNFDTVS